MKLTKKEPEKVITIVLQERVGAKVSKTKSFTVYECNMDEVYRVIINAIKEQVRE